MVLLISILLCSIVVLCSVPFMKNGECHPRAGIVSCTPLLLIGIVSSLLLTIFGTPLIEWLLPLLVMIAVASSSKPTRTVVSVAVVETLLSLAGVSWFINIVIVENEYAVVSPLLTHMDRAVENTQLHAAQKKLFRTLEVSKIYPPNAGPVNRSRVHNSSRIFQRMAYVVHSALSSSSDGTSNLVHRRSDPRERKQALHGVSLSPALDAVFIDYLPTAG